MEKMSKQQIEQIGKSMLLESDIIAKHGTSIANGLSIMDTGFNFHRTSMVIQKTNSIVDLCTYGWKENKKGDAVNIIISMPKSFFKELFQWDDEQYLNIIQSIKNDNKESALITFVSDSDIHGPIFNVKVPKEFIRGMFVYTDNKDYLCFTDNPEDGMNYLSYVDNPNFYDNLDKDKKKTFLEKMHKKIFGEEEKEKTI